VGFHETYPIVYMPSVLKVAFKKLWDI